MSTSANESRSPARIVLATRNEGKIRELRSVLAGSGLSISGLEDFPVMPDVEETGDTLEENALIKAKAVHESTGLPAVADDSGLEVDALNGLPGVHSARYAGPDCRDEDNRRKLIDAMRDIGDRGARFRTVIVYLDATRTEYFEGVCTGRIALSERGSGGFGYDALFIPDGYEETFAELPPEEKNAISHRGRGARKLAEFLIRLEGRA